MFSRDCREDETILGYYFLLAGEAISFSLMMVSASVFCSSSLTVASLALSESPLMMASSSDSALFFAAGAGLDLSAVCDAFAMYAIHCLSSPINALKL